MKIAFIINSHAFTAIHRISLAKFLNQKSHDVIFFIAGENSGASKVISKEFTFKTFGMSRSGKNIIDELLSLYKLASLIKHEKPDCVINATIKPVLYGTLASHILGVPNIINLITGLGSVFINKDGKKSHFKYLIMFLYQLSFFFIKQNVIFQNKSDLRAICKNEKSYKAKHHLIPGSGIDPSPFNVKPFPKIKRVIFVGRMIFEKGLKTFIECAQSLSNIRNDISFVMVGPYDKGNPSAINKDLINHWTKNPAIEYWGNEDNISQVYEKASIVVLPSLREGMPKVLMEAGLSGRPVIASNVPGCRDVVLNEKTGLLFKLNDVNDLEKKILKIIDDLSTMRVMGKNAKSHIKMKFSTSIVMPKFESIIVGNDKKIRNNKLV